MVHGIPNQQVQRRKIEPSMDHGWGEGSTYLWYTTVLHGFSHDLRVVVEVVRSADWRKPTE